MFSVLLAALLVLPSAARLGAQERPLRIVSLGDSITRGVRPGVKAEETYAAVLQAELGKRGVKAEVTNVGIGGERTDQALQRLANCVLALKPAVVTILYGTNDSYIDRGRKEPRLTVEQYRANLRRLVEELRRAGAKAVLMTPPRWGAKAAADGSGKDPNISLEPYVRACRALAAEMKVPLADHFAHWSKQAKAGVDLGQWTTDQCHPNPRGHRELVEVMLPAVLAALRPQKGAP